MTLLTSQFCWNRKSRSGDRTELAAVSSGFSGTNYTSVCLRGCWREFSLRSPVCCLPGKMVETALVQPLFPLNSIRLVSGVCSRQQTQINERASIASNNILLFGLSLQICVSACADSAQQGSIFSYKSCDSCEIEGCCAPLQYRCLPQGVTTPTEKVWGEHHQWGSCAGPSGWTTRLGLLLASFSHRTLWYAVNFFLNSGLIDIQGDKCYAKKSLYLLIAPWGWLIDWLIDW